MRALWIGLICFPVFWGVLALLAQLVRISPDWGLGRVAAGVAAAVAVILLLYRYEAWGGDAATGALDCRAGLGGASGFSVDFDRAGAGAGGRAGGKAWSGFGVG